MTEPRIGDELRRMEEEYEPLLPVETKLIWGTLAAGIVLSVILVLLSRALS
jgi:hypothetical protein